MPIFEKDGKRLLFVHIPKTGGTAVYEHLKPHFSVSFHRQGNEQTLKPTAIKVNPQHFTAEDIALMFPEGYFDYRFAIVRDPMTRVVSEYKWRSRFFKKEVEFNDWIVEQVEEYRKSPFHYDNHIRPQSDFVDESLEVFRMEDGLSPVIQRINERLGLKLPEMVSRANQSPQKSLKFTRANRALVKSLYQADFERFGY